MSNPPDQPSTPQLSPEDVRALESFVQAGWLGATSNPRHARLASLLSPLQTASPNDTTLAQRTLDAVLLARAQSDAAADSSDIAEALTLSELDQEALDALMLEGLQPRRVPASLRERAARAHALLALAGADVAHAGQADASLSQASLSQSSLSQASLTQPGLTQPGLSQPSPELIDRTMQRVLAVRAQTPIALGEVSRRGSLPLREIASIAAVLFIGGITLWPMAAAAGSARERSVCESNMASLAGAFGRYGADFRGLLPVASQPSQRRSDAPWWNVGSGPAQSNSANLFTIHVASYAPIEASCCPGNPKGCRSHEPNRTDWNTLEQVSYSYYVMFGERTPSWSGESQPRPASPSSPSSPSWEGRAGESNTTVVLADSSPVIRRAVRNQVVSVGENSANHAGSGQRVLRVDGSSDWLATPYDAGPGRNTRRHTPQGQRQRLGTADNIWLPVSLEETLLTIRTQQEQGVTQGTIAIPTPEQAARIRSVRLHGTETPGNANDAFLGP